MAQKKYKNFASVSEAFDYCREQDRPVRAMVRGLLVKVYPSGLLERAVKTADILDFKSRAAGEKDNE